MSAGIEAEEVAAEQEGVARLGDVDSYAGKGAALPVTDKYRQIVHAKSADAGLDGGGQNGGLGDGEGRVRAEVFQRHARQLHDAGLLAHLELDAQAVGAVGSRDRAGDTVFFPSPASASASGQATPV